MIQVVNKVIDELNQLASTSSAYGGLSGVIDMTTPAKFGDPGWVLYDEYPFFMVIPNGEALVSESIGLAGRDVRNLSMQVVLLIRANEYFDKTISDSEVDRLMVDVAARVRQWFARLGKRRLEPVAGVRSLVIPTITYGPQERGEVFAKSAVINLVVQKQYQHQE
jgi:hypothetical protein